MKRAITLLLLGGALAAPLHASSAETDAVRSDRARVSLVSEVASVAMSLRE